MSNKRKILFSAAVSYIIQHLESGQPCIATEKDMWRVQLYPHIKTKGEVTNASVWEDVMKNANDNDLTSEAVYQMSVTDGVLQSSHVVAEVSRLSHGVGMEIGLAIANQIPVLCLYRAFGNEEFGKPDNLTRMIRGAPVKVVEYNSVQEAKDVIDQFLY